MAHKKTQLVLPQAHSARIDALVGERKRRAFSEVAAREVRRRRLLRALSKDAPAWDPADHPDIEVAGGAAAWVRRLRREADKASRRRLRGRRG